MDAATAAELPDAYSCEEGAGITLPFRTAWNALVLRDPHPPPCERNSIGFVCCRCYGKEANEIPVHHIDGDISHNDIARLDPRSGWLRGNLVPLCNECHRWVHQNLSDKEAWPFLKDVLNAFLAKMPDTTWSRKYVWYAEKLKQDKKMQPAESGPVIESVTEAVTEVKEDHRT